MPPKKATEVSGPSNEPINPFLVTGQVQPSPSIHQLRSSLTSDNNDNSNIQTVTFGDLENTPIIQSGDKVGWGDNKALLEDKRKMNKPTDIEDSHLHEVRGPILGLSHLDENYSAVIIHFIACKSITNLRRNEANYKQLLARVEKAHELGSAFNERRLIKIPLTRTQERTIFKAALDQLDEVLSNIYRYEEKNIVGYEVDEEIYGKLCKELLKLRGEAYDSLISKGRGLPILPRWGHSGDIRTIWSKNDFEVLGATYRAEVELFLATLAKYHQFQGEEEDNKNPGIQQDKKIEIPSNEQETPQNQITTPLIKHEEEQTSEIQAENGKGKERVNQFDLEPSYDSISQVYRPNNLRHSRVWGRKAVSAFGHPLDNTNGRGVKDMFGRNQPLTNRNDSSKRSPDDNRGTDARRNQIANNPGPPDGDDGDDDGDPKGNRPFNRGNPRGNPSSNPTIPGKETSSEAQFDNKLKIEIIPTWDGDIDTLGRWVLKINRLSERSRTVYKQLGILVPSRLTGAAETWYYSQSSETREQIEENWGTLREAFGAYYMNRAYMDRQKARANRASYRDSENLKESPSEYFIRKLELLELVYDYTDVELINEIMSGAPSYWVSILTPHLYQRLDDFQLAIKFHEHNLTDMDLFQTNRPYGYSSRNPFGRFRNARVNLVGWSKSTANPPFPKDDTTVSPKGTPEEKGARPCRHCGSGKHWDPDCKYARKGEKRARVNAVESLPEDISAQEEYNALYYEGISEDETDF